MEEHCEKCGCHRGWHDFATKHFLERRGCSACGNCDEEINTMEKDKDLIEIRIMVDQVAKDVEEQIGRFEPPDFDAIQVHAEELVSEIYSKKKK